MGGGPEGAQKRVEEEEADEEVAYAVDDIVGDAGNPPGEAGFGTEHEAVGDLAESTEAEAKNTRDESHLDVGWIFSEKKGNGKKDWPGQDIAVEPPAEAVDDAFDDYEDNDGEDGVPTEEGGVKNSKKGDHLDVGKGIKSPFTSDHGGNHHGNAGYVVCC